MLKKIFDWQINRLFWPEDFMPSSNEADFPDYMRKILKTRLKTVYYYNTSHPTLELRVSQPVAALLQRSIARLPQAPNGLEAAPAPDTALSCDTDFPYTGGYRHVRVQDFLTAMQPCFADAA